MGEPIIKQVGQSNGTAKGTGREQTTTGKSTRTTSTDTTGTGTGTGTGTTTGGGSTTGKGTTEKEVVSRLAHVEDEQAKRDARNARRRELYAKKKAEQGQPVKTRKPTNKSQPSETVGTEQITALIGMVSAVVASRPNMAHWQLTPQEIESLSKPLSNVLSNSEAFKGLAEHGDAVALVTACVTILLPRLVITMTMKKERRKANVGRNSKPVSPKSNGNKDGKNHDDSGNNDTRITDNGTVNGQGEFFFGEPISI